MTTYETLYSWYLNDAEDFPTEEIISFEEFVEFIKKEEMED